MKKTGIQWCDSTVSPTTGCDGCELWELLRKGPCYAGNLHEQRLAPAMPDLYAASFTEVRLAPGRMIKAAGWSDLTGTDRPDKPWLNGLPRMIFVDDMADLFSKAVPFEYIKAELIEVAASPKGQRHIWMVLTKQPARMEKFDTWLRAHGVRWPENVWAGTSVTSRRTLKRLNYLRRVAAPVRFVSIEPLLEDLGSLTTECLIPATGDHPDMVGYMVGPDDGESLLYKTPAEALAKSGISLWIVGGESDQRNHRGRDCDLTAVRSIVGQCRKAKVSVFVKQLGSRPVEGREVLSLRDSHGGDPDEWPEDLRVREFPTVCV